MVTLQKERERRGLSLDEVASRARIPRRYLVALEEGDRATLPPGPFYTAYRKQYLEFLGLSEASLDGRDSLEPSAASPHETQTMEADAEIEETTRTFTVPRGQETPVGRLVVTGFVLTMALLLVMKVGSTLIDAPSAAAPPEQGVAVEGGPSQRLSARAIEPVDVELVADGRVIRSGRLAPGETAEAVAHERVEILAKDLTRVVIFHDGEKVEPLANLTRARRLVFILDSP